MANILKVLFLCTGNSCRSQMAEGFARALKSDCIEPYSAGIETHGLNPRAVQVMAEAGVDISEQHSKHLDEVKHIPFDYVITVCSHANEHCPLFPGKIRVIHVGFDDPPALAKSASSEEETLNIYRRVRDEIKAFIETLPRSIQETIPMDSQEKTREMIRQGYSKIAQGNASCSCCGCSSPEALAKGIGYSDNELMNLPEGANMGLSCGNPTALANLKPGQTVLDLGSGGGFDVFIAAKKVGPSGLAIGVDMTPDMLQKSRNSIASFTASTGLNNVEFRLGEIEHLPVADHSVDVVISNCVINLSPDKPQVWREIARVLKPGAKACISDLALKKPLPLEIRDSVAALVSCVAGAVLIEDTLAMAKSAGLENITIVEKSYNLDVMADCNDPLYKEVKQTLPPGSALSDYIVSIDITAFLKMS